MFKKAYPQTEKDLLPMSMRPQAHDIIRTWAFDTIVKSWMHRQTYSMARYCYFWPCADKR